MSRLQAQAEASSKELMELRHQVVIIFKTSKTSPINLSLSQHGRLRKSHSEKLEELSHCSRKGEAFEKEVRQLRMRIEELRRELGKAEDSNDESANAIRYFIFPICAFLFGVFLYSSCFLYALRHNYWPVVSTYRYSYIRCFGSCSSKHINPNSQLIFSYRSLQETSEEQRRTPEPSRGIPSSDRAPFVKVYTLRFALKFAEK